MENASDDQIANPPVVAGIINLLTGEISDLIHSTANKTRLNLKVRDELRAHSQDDTYLVFDVRPGSIGNLDYIRSKFRAPCSVSMDQLYLWRVRLAITKLERELAEMLDGLTTAQAVKSECLALYEDTSPEKRAVVESALSDEITRIEEQIENSKYQLADLKRNEQKLTKIVISSKT